MFPVSPNGKKEMFSVNNKKNLPFYVWWTHSWPNGTDFVSCTLLKRNQRRLEVTMKSLCIPIPVADCWLKNLQMLFILSEKKNEEAIG